MVQNFSPHLSTKRGETFLTESKTRKFSVFFDTRIEFIKSGALLKF